MAYRKNPSCKKGHLYTADNTHIAKDGSRVCRTCQREAMKVYREKNKRVKLKKLRPVPDYNSIFWSKVDRGRDCWEWVPALNSNGYGVFYYNKKAKILAHRYSYQLKNGGIPDGMSICHKCDNRKWVNPDHLFAGTQKDNISDCASKGRLRNQIKTACKRGHVYTKEDVGFRNGKACRVCKTCEKEMKRRYYDMYGNSRYQKLLAINL